MHANTIYKETKTIAALAVALLAVLAVAAVAMSSESSAESNTGDSYKVVIHLTSENGSTSTSSFALAAGIPIYVDDDGTNTLHVNKIKMTPSIPADTERYDYDFSGWMYKATDADDSEYAPIPADGTVLSEDITIKGDILATTQQYEVTVVPNEEGYGTVGFFVPNAAEGLPAVVVSYRSVIYTSANTLVVTDSETEEVYTAIATPAAFDGDNLYNFAGWDLAVSQVTGALTVTASFEAVPKTFAYEGVMYSVISDSTVEATGFDGTPAAVSIPASVPYNGAVFVPVSVAEYAFNGCETLTSIFVGESVEEIGFYALNGPMLASISVSPDNQNYASIAGVLYDKNIETLIQFPCAKQRLIIPDTVTTIAAGAFAQAGQALKDAYQGGDITYFRYVSIPASVTSIGFEAFNNSTLEVLKFEQSSSVELADRAFAYCESLDYIVFPESLEIDGPSTFQGCTFYDENGNEMQADADALAGHKFTGDDATNLKVYVPEAGKTITTGGIGYKILSGDSFKVSVVKVADPTITDLYIPARITYLGFEWSVASVASKAFYGNTTITGVASLAPIGFKAFSGCTSLDTVILNFDGAIGNYAFYGCTSLSIVSMTGVTEIGDSAFSGCSALTTIDLSGVQKIGAHAFYNCALTAADLSSATVVDYGAFSGNDLTSVKFAAAPSYVDSKAFYGYTFNDIDGNKIVVSADTVAGLAFSGSDKVLNAVLLN